MKPVDAVAATAQPPEPIWPPSATIEWERFECFADPFAAHIVAGLLENEGVPAIVAVRGVLASTLGDACIWVPKALAHRARWILAISPPGDAELNYLATGELPAQSVG